MASDISISVGADTSGFITTLGGLEDSAMRLASVVLVRENSRVSLIGKYAESQKAKVRALPRKLEVCPMKDRFY